MVQPTRYFLLATTMALASSTVGCVGGLDPTHPCDPDAPESIRNTAKIVGRVVDENGNGLAGIPVGVVGRANSGVSGTDGAFEISNLPPNIEGEVYEVQATPPGDQVGGRTTLSASMKCLQESASVNIVVVTPPPAPEVEVIEATGADRMMVAFGAVAEDVTRNTDEVCADAMGADASALAYRVQVRKAFGEWQDVVLQTDVSENAMMQAAHKRPMAANMNQPRPAFTLERTGALSVAGEAAGTGGTMLDDMAVAGALQWRISAGCGKETCGAYREAFPAVANEPAAVCGEVVGIVETDASGHTVLTPLDSNQTYNVRVVTDRALPTATVESQRLPASVSSALQGVPRVASLVPKKLVDVPLPHNIGELHDIVPVGPNAFMAIEDNQVLSFSAAEIPGLSGEEDVAGAMTFNETGFDGASDGLAEDDNLPPRGERVAGGMLPDPHGILTGDEDTSLFGEPGLEAGNDGYQHGPNGGVGNGEAEVRAIIPSSTGVRAWVQYGPMAMVHGVNAHGGQGMSQGWLSSHVDLNGELVNHLRGFHWLGNARDGGAQRYMLLFDKGIVLMERAAPNPGDAALLPWAYARQAWSSLPYPAGCQRGSCKLSACDTAAHPEQCKLKLGAEAVAAAHKHGNSALCGPRVAFGDGQFKAAGAVPFNVATSMRDGLLTTEVCLDLEALMFEAKYRIDEGTSDATGDLAAKLRTFSALDLGSARVVKLPIEGEVEDVLVMVDHATDALLLIRTAKLTHPYAVATDVVNGNESFIAKVNLRHRAGAVTASRLLNCETDAHEPVLLVANERAHTVEIFQHTSGLGFERVLDVNMPGAPVGFLTDEASSMTCADPLTWVRTDNGYIVPIDMRSTSMRVPQCGDGACGIYDQGMSVGAATRNASGRSRIMLGGRRRLSELGFARTGN